MHDYVKIQLLKHKGVKKPPRSWYRGMADKDEEQRQALNAWIELTPEERLSIIAEHKREKEQKRKDKEEQSRIEQAANDTCKGISNSSDRLVFVIVLW